MKKQEVLKLLEDNGYQKHPLLGFYWNKKSLGYCFILEDKAIIVFKNKWKNIDLNTEKRILYNNFSPSLYNLKSLKPSVKKTINKQKVINKSNEIYFKIDTYINGEEE
jgi:hypothetical protein